MAINSYGYPETIEPGSVFAKHAGQGFGHRYSVLGFSDFRVTAAASGTRQVNIAAGWAMGQGILVQNTAPTTYNFPAASGASQWMLIGLKRWNGAGPAYTSILTHVLGTASRAVPSVTQTPGTNDTQWLALCRITTADALVQEVIDLRLISTEGGGNYEVYSDLALNQLNDAIGARVWRADTTDGHIPAFYERIASTTGVLSWKNLYEPDTELSGTAATAVAGAGWARQSTCKMVRNGKHRSMVLELNRTGGVANAFTSNGNGGLGDVLLAELHTMDRPPTGVVIPLVGRIRDESGSNATYGCFGHVTSDGNVYVNSMLPNITVSSGDQLIVAGEWYRS
jgi:hypothetical protein